MEEGEADRPAIGAEEIGKRHEFPLLGLEREPIGIDGGVGRDFGAG